MIKRILLLSLTLCFFSVSAYAQQPILPGIDLFGSDENFTEFDDILEGVEFPDTKCDPCQIIRDEISKKEKEIAEMKEEKASLEKRIGATEEGLNDAKGDLQEAQDELKELQDPQNFVESEGRRYDSSDHAAMQRRNGNLWDAYKAGDISAEEYSEEIGKPFDDPDVQKELEKLKKEIEEELEEKIEELEDLIEETEENIEDMKEETEELQKKIDECGKKLQELQASLKDCEKRCQEEVVNIPEDYGFTQEKFSFWDRVKSWFGFGPKKEDPVLTLPEDFFLPPLEQEPFTPIETELIQLDLVSVEPIIIVDPLPPVVCHLCDPIRAEIATKQKALADMQNQKAAAEGKLDAVNKAIDQNQKARDSIQKQLDAFNTPDDFVEDDQGNRYDSSDHAAMRVRNSRLWSAYRSGRMSADDLQNEWEKDFTDPDVQADLEKIKKDIRDKMEQSIKDLDRERKDLEKTQGELQAEIKDLGEKIAKCEKELEELKKKLEECEKKCKEKSDAVIDLVFPEFEDFIFEDGFESGDTSRWSTDLDGEEDDDEDVEEQDTDDDDEEEIEEEEEEEEEESSSAEATDDKEEEIQDDTKDTLVCPDLSYKTKEECQSVCSNNPDAECAAVLPIEDSERNRDCYSCVPKKFAECPADAKYESETECSKYCDGACGMQWVFDKRCYGCRICPQSPSWHTERDCENACDGRCHESYEKVNGIGIDCFTCEKAEECPKGTDYESFSPDCRDCSSGECTILKQLPNDLHCIQCLAPKIPEPEYCDFQTQELQECQKNCDGECVYDYRRKDGVECFGCLELPDTEPTCPIGTADLGTCEDQCSGQGTCIEKSGGCYQCAVVNCPSGTFQDSCPAECSDGCDVVGQQFGIQCLKCRQSCTDVCLSNGFGPEETDHSNAILSELQNYSCVSGASISIQTANINGCTCIGDYSLSIDTTPPVCRGTPCGDVQCGQSATCQEGDTTITATCNWGGWEKIQKHQFRPVVGN